MIFFTTVNAQSFAFAGYVLCSVVLNGVALLISLFYRKKFRHPSPRWCFVVSIVFSLLYCILLTVGNNGSALSIGVAQLVLAGSALASVASTVNLFQIMQKVRK
jgi:hypothetical protein